jgi:hypothetical protein
LLRRRWRPICGIGDAAVVMTACSQSRRVLRCNRSGLPERGGGHCPDRAAARGRANPGHRRAVCKGNPGAEGERGERSRRTNGEDGHAHDTRSQSTLAT